MKICSEKSLSGFDFWSGAVDRVKCLNDKQLDEIESVLEELYPDGMPETQINDLFWFEEDLIAEWLGFGSFEEIMNDSEDED